MQTHAQSRRPRTRSPTILLALLLAAPGWGLLNNGTNGALMWPEAAKHN